MDIGQNLSNEFASDAATARNRGVTADKFRKTS
jgi:hypothetical protein